MNDPNPIETSAETRLDGMQIDFNQPNLPETHTSWSVQDTVAANAQFLEQGHTKTLIWIVGSKPMTTGGCKCPAPLCAAPTARSWARWQ